MKNLLLGLTLLLSMSSFGKDSNSFKSVIINPFSTEIKVTASKSPNRDWVDLGHVVLFLTPEDLTEIRRAKKVASQNNKLALIHFSRNPDYFGSGVEDFISTEFVESNYQEKTDTNLEIVKSIIVNPENVNIKTYATGQEGREWLEVNHETISINFNTTPHLKLAIHNAKAMGKRAKLNFITSPGYFGNAYDYVSVDYIY